MERRNFLKLGAGAALGGALAACGDSGSDYHWTPPPTPEPARNKVAIGWNNVALAAIRATRPSPPQAARSLAIMHTAMYDAWAAYDTVAVATRLGAQLRRPRAEQTVANQVRAFSYAAYAALLDQFPAQKAAFDAHMASLGYRPADASLDFNLPHGVGTGAALSVIEHAHADGANQLGTLTAGGIPFADYSGYVARNAPLLVAQPTPRGTIAAPARWQPLRYQDASGVLRTQAYMLPFWGQVKPFALSVSSQFRPLAPAALGSAEFRDQVRHVANLQPNLTETEKVQIDFWAGASSGELPSGYWAQFAQWVSARDKHDEAADVKLFFALSNALFDAGIAAWEAKRTYDSARPITAIRHLLGDEILRGYGFDGPAGGLRAISGAAWVPYHPATFPTPPMPEHVSGHSTYSAASAAVLRLFTGSDTFKHSTTVAPRSMLLDPALPATPLTLAWDTFTYAACEAGLSRVNAGIHFPQADLMGRSLGEQVGAAVFAKAQSYWMGRG